MTSSPGPGWWLATDGSWYPPEAHPDVASRPRAAAPAGARVSGPARRPSLRPYATALAAPAATPAPPTETAQPVETAAPVETALPAETIPITLPVEMPPAPAQPAPPPAVPEVVAEAQLDVGANALIPLDGAFDAIPDEPAPPAPPAIPAPTAPSAIDELLAAVDTSTAASVPEAVDVPAADLIPLEAPEVAGATPPLQQEMDPTAALSRFTPAAETPAPRAYQSPEAPLEHDPLAAVAAEPVFDDYEDDIASSPVASADAAEPESITGPDAWDTDPDDLAAELEGSQRSEKDQKRYEREAKKASLKEAKEAAKAAKEAAKAEAKNASSNRTGISAVSILVLLALVVAAGTYYWMFIRETDADPADGADSARSGTVSVFDLGVGNCIGDAGESVALTGEIKQLPSVACTQPHQHEVFHIAVFEPASASFDIDAIGVSATAECRNRLEEILNQTVSDAGLAFSMLYPTEQSWAEDDRSTLCIVSRPGGLLEAPLAELGQ